MPESMNTSNDLTWEERTALESPLITADNFESSREKMHKGLKYVLARLEKLGVGVEKMIEVANLNRMPGVNPYRGGGRQLGILVPV